MWDSVGYFRLERSEHFWLAEDEGKSMPKDTCHSRQDLARPHRLFPALVVVAECSSRPSRGAGTIGRAVAIVRGITEAMTKGATKPVT